MHKWEDYLIKTNTVRFDYSLKIFINTFLIKQRFLIYVLINTFIQGEQFFFKGKPVSIFSTRPESMLLRDSLFKNNLILV